jgi:hypothetical protein
MSGLTFLNPLFISLLPLAALPILFHLFFRLKKRPRVFSTLLFFHRIDPRLNARRRLREWLVLLLRTLLILFLLLALARPVWRGIGREGTVAAVLVVDNSGSMSGAGASGRSKLKEAVAAAQDRLAALRDKDSAALVLLVEDPSVPVLPALTTDKAAVKAALDRVSETEATGSVARALEHALALLDPASARDMEIHVFSDLQANKWSQASEQGRAPKQGTWVVAHRLASPGAGKLNVALTGIRLLDKVILSGRRVPMQVSVGNLSGGEGRVRLNWTDDAGNQGLEEVTVPARGERTLSLLLEAPNAGNRWLNLWLEGDEFTADNRAGLAFFCAERRPVLFAGRREEFGQLPLAISPTSDGRLSGLIPQVVEPSGLAAKLRETGPLFLVLTWQSWPQLNAGPAAAPLRQFFAAGGSGLVVPSATRAPVSPGRLEGLEAALEAFQTNSAGRAVVVLQRGHAIFNALRDEKGEVPWHNVKAFRWQPLRLGSPATPLLGLDDGQVLLAELKLGKGTLFLSGIAFASDWTTLPLKPGFLALAQSMALTGASASQDLAPLVAGEPWRQNPAQPGELHVQSVTGGPLDWKGRHADLATFPRAGVYTVQAGTNVTYVAVRASDREGRQQFITGDELPALGKLAYTLTTESSRGVRPASAAASGKSLNLSLPLLLAAVLAFWLEGWLANPGPVKLGPLQARAGRA